MASRRRTPAAKSSSLDDQFDAFLKASMGSDSDTSLSKYIQPKPKKEKPWWQSSVETSEEFDTNKDTTGGFGTLGKSFLKKKKPLIPPIAPKTPDGGSQNISGPPPPPKDEEPVVQRESVSASQPLRDIITGPFSARISGTEPTQRSSRLLTETEEFRESQLSFDQSTETGHETMEEAADKSRFFKKLSAGAEGSLDYAKLNKQLGETGQTSFFDKSNQPADHQHSGPAAERFDDDSLYPLQDDRPATYMGDEPPDTEQSTAPETANRPNLLANVSLNDTLDTSIHGTTAPTADQSGGMGNTSQLDFDAVHQAYQEVHDKEGTAHTLPFTNPDVALAEPVNQSEEFTEKTTSHTEDVPVWQTNSRREGESQATSLWDLQPATEAAESPRQVSQRASPDSAPSSAQRSTQEVPLPGGAQGATGVYQNVWDLEPISQSDLPPELVPITSNEGTTTPKQNTQAANQINDWRSGRVTPPTAVEYQTIDQLSPITQDQAFPPSQGIGDQQTPSKAKFKKCMGRTQTLHRPVTSHSSADKFAHVKSSGYGVVYQTPTKARSSSPKARSPSKSGKKRKSLSSGRPQSSPGKGIESPEPTESSPIKVLQSVESFANYLREQFVSSTPASKIEAPFFGDVGGGISSSVIHSDRETALLNEIREWQQKWRDECRMKEKINADFMSAQKQWDRYNEECRLRHEQEIGRLRQQVYILEAKASLHSGSGEKTASDGSERSVKDTIAKLEAEIQSQENLLSGYQLENEKLYKEMKQMDSLHKGTYDRLYQENHKQATELAQLREALSQREAELRVKGINYPVTYGYGANQPVIHDVRANPLSEVGAPSDTPMTAALGSGRIAELKSQLVKAKGDVGSLAASVSVLTQKNADLSTQLENTTRDRDKLRELLMVSKQPAEVKVTQERYQQEINVLEKKIRWYVDNQKILDTDVERLRQKDCEINQLNNRIKQLDEQKLRSYDGTQRAKDRAADTKRIKDLERQVREMEQILRKRNPNSIPSLIWAASVMPDSRENRPPSMRFLEDRVSQLEKELAEKDGETSRLLRAMEQQCNQSKVLYEQRIAELEAASSKGDRPEQSNRHSTVSALDKDLQAAREQHRKRQQEQQALIDSLREEISNLKHKAAVSLKSENRSLRQSRDHNELLTADLQHQLDSKLAEIARLHEAVDRLQKEKRQLLVELNFIQSITTHSAPEAAKVSSSKSPSKVADGKTIVISSLSPSKKRQYQPQEFSAEHISDVLELNRALAIKYEDAQIELSQLRVDHQRQLAQLESQMRSEQSELQSKLKHQEIQSQREKEQLIAKFALKHSENDVTKFKNEINSLETVIKHLKEDRLHWQTDTEELSSLRIRNITLDNRIRALEDQLEDAKEHHTPEMRHFERLRDKISKMEDRFSMREIELKKVITQNQVTYQEDLRVEVLKWKSIVQSKNRDIEKFRAELDSILSVLKELRRQGVTIPLAT